LVLLGGQKERYLKMKKLFSTVGLIALTLVAFGILNAYIAIPDLARKGEIVAYRGGGGTLVDSRKLKETGCTAKSIIKSDASSVENTLQAAASSVNAGADVIHLNVHRTLDDQLIVFHDWTLDCATNKSGPVHKANYSEIQAADAGFGYTADNDQSFPYRGRGFSISRLDEFYSRFPKQTFWLNLKDNDERSFSILHAYLANKTPDDHLKTTLITSRRGLNWFKNKNATIDVISVGSVKECGIDYLMLGWAGIVPESCKNTTLLIPPSKAKYFWGYPRRMASRLQSHGTDIYLWSKNREVDQKNASLIVEGVGIVTSDLNLISKARSYNPVN
jgi:glycerophosphoryl diester phosphodiesterase